MGPSKLLDEVINPGRGLLKWAWRQGREGIDIDRGYEEASELGKVVHRDFEDLVKGRVGPLEDYAKPHRPVLQRLRDWYEETGPEVYKVEEWLHLEALGINCRADLIRWCPGCPKCAEAALRGVVITDFKTGSVKEKDHFQVGGCYPAAWAEENPEPVCGAELVILGEKADYHTGKRIVAAVGTYEGFLAAVEWRRHLEAAKGAMKNGNPTS